MTGKETMRGTAIVTGASAGLGKIYAERLAKRGYDLILVARRKDRLEQLADVLTNQYGIRAEALVADLSLTEDVNSVAERIAHDSSVVFLVNNAGTSKLGPTQNSQEVDEHAMIQLNVVALTRLTVTALQGFRDRNHGTIVNVGSILGFQSIPMSSVYSGTKSYVLGFTRSIQDELEGTDVVVQLVAPAATATDIWEIAGVPLSNLDPATVMTAEDCVDSAMEGLTLGERVTLNSVEDLALLGEVHTANQNLLRASQTGRPASRYKLGTKANA
jgi:short-subunit dehydrogenase